MIVDDRADNVSDPSLPVPPKGPASAYTLFVKEWFTKNRSSLTPSSTTGKLSMRDVANQMGAAWQELADSARGEYTKQAKELKTAYDKEYRSFLDGLSDDSIKAIEKATGKKLRVPGGRKARKAELSRASGSPGKPLTAFFEFMKEFREKEDASGFEGREKQIELSKRAGEKWKNMSEGDKQVSTRSASPPCNAVRPVGEGEPGSTLLAGPLS